MLAFLVATVAAGAAIGGPYLRQEARPADAEGPLAVRALAPDIVKFIVDGDGGPNAAVPGPGLIQTADGLNVLEVLLPGDMSASLGGNGDFYPDYGETALIEAFGASDSPPGGPPQMNITAGQASLPTLDGKLAIVVHTKRPASHGGQNPGDAETGMITLGASRPGFIYHEARLALAAPHLMGPVDPTFATVTCGSLYSYTLGGDPFTGAGKADFADGDCDGVIHGPMDYDNPQSFVGACLANYLVGPLIPNDPTCREDSLVIAHIMAESPATPLGVATATVTQAPAPDAGMAGIGSATSGGTGGALFEVMGDPVGFMVLQNPHCNDGAVPACVPDPLSTGNAAPNECQPQPAMDLGSGATVFTWDQIDNTDNTLALASYAPVSAEGRRLTRYRMTWDSDDDNIAHPQENFSVSFNIPIALPYPIEGVHGANLLCSGTTPGTANVTVTTGSLSNTFPVTVESVTSLRLDMDTSNGNGVCDPIDQTVSANLGAGTVRVGVCLLNPLGAQPVAAYSYRVTYNDTIIVAPEVADLTPSLDDNPDANVGSTTFTSTKYPNHLGENWTCDGGVGAHPKGDDNALTGAANGEAFSGGCNSAAGPNTLLAGPLGVITFDAIAAGQDTLAFGPASVIADDLSEIGSCNQPGEIPIDCIGGTVTVGGACPLGVPNSDPDTRPNGPNIEGDDATWPEHDEQADLCDMDDDNDGLVDFAEMAGISCGTMISSPTDVDTDGDHLHDGWECANGSNPFDAASTFKGSGTADGDNDRVPDLWEMRGYNGSAGSTDSDGDGCHDMVEIGSVNGNRALEDADRLATARRVLGLLATDPEQDYVLDLNKNGAADDGDRLFVSRAVLLPEWLPKTCP
jgi:hypothetical protein